MSKLGRIEAPHFVAGFDLVDDRVTQVAPIIQYMTGWSSERVWRYCLSKGWVLERVW